LTQLGQGCLKERRIANEKLLRVVAQGQVNQWRPSAFGGEYIRDHPRDGTPGTGIGLVQQGTHLPNTGAESLVAALQTFQHFDSARHAAALCPQVSHALAGLLDLLAQLLAALAKLPQALALESQPTLKSILGVAELLEFQIERGKVLGRLGALQVKAVAFAAEVFHLGLKAGSVILQPGSGAHLLQVLVLGDMHLVLQHGHPVHRRAQVLFQFAHLLALALTGRLSAGMFRGGVLGFSSELGDASSQLGQLHARAADFGFEVSRERLLVAERGFLGGDLFANLSQTSLFVVNFLIKLGQCVFKLAYLRLPGRGMRALSL
jgi:hypothetical protein